MFYRNLTLSTISSKVVLYRLNSLLGATPSQGALAYCLSHPAVATVVAGAMTVQELAEDAAAARFAPLPADLLDEIGRAQRDIGPAL